MTERIAYKGITETQPREDISMCYSLNTAINHLMETAYTCADIQAFTYIATAIMFPTMIAITLTLIVEAVRT